MPPGGLNIGGEPIRKVDGARFLGVWVNEGCRWNGQIERVRAKVGRLLGVLGRAGTVMGGKALSMLYNSLVLPHLQYCLMAWGDFQGNRNLTLGDSLLKLQKRFAGIIAGKHGKYHSDPIFADQNILKIGDLYRQQLRIHAWKFWNGRLPDSQASMLNKVSDTHNHFTRKARMGLTFTTQDQRSIGYRVPKEWDSLAEAEKQAKTLSCFKNQSKRYFLNEYRAFNCMTKDCFICRSERDTAENRSAELA